MGEALTFEREREQALRWQLAEIALAVEVAAIDAAAYAQLEPAEVALVQSLLGGIADDGPPDEEEDWFGAVSLDAADDVASDPAAELEAELARLMGEIDESQLRQQVLARFIAALAASAEPPV